MKQTFFDVLEEAIEDASEKDIEKIFDLQKRIKKQFDKFEINLNHLKYSEVKSKL